MSGLYSRKRLNLAPLRLEFEKWDKYPHKKIKYNNNKHRRLCALKTVVITI